MKKQLWALAILVSTAGISQSGTEFQIQGSFNQLSYPV